MRFSSIICTNLKYVQSYYLFYILFCFFAALCPQPVAETPLGAAVVWQANTRKLALSALDASIYNPDHGPRIEPSWNPYSPIISHIQNGGHPSPTEAHRKTFRINEGCCSSEPLRLFFVASGYYSPGNNFTGPSIRYKA